MYPLIERYLSSGQGQRDFCDLHQIKVCTFQYWYGKYRRDHPSDGVSATGFVSLEVVDDQPESYALEIREACGRHLCFRDLPPARYLKALLC